MRRTQKLALWAFFWAALCSAGLNWLFGGLPWLVLIVFGLVVAGGIYSEMLKLVSRETIIDSPTITPRKP